MPDEIRGKLNARIQCILVTLVIFIAHLVLFAAFVQDRGDQYGAEYLGKIAEHYMNGKDTAWSSWTSDRRVTTSMRAPSKLNTHTDFSAVMSSLFVTILSLKLIMHIVTRCKFAMFEQEHERYREAYIAAR